MGAWELQLILVRQYSFQMGIPALCGIKNKDITADE
jgi:hypothetical protein